MKRNYPYLVIPLMAVLFILPNVITHNMIVGSDAVFHFNRFYDTAMQIKNGNFEYFITLYGFQQSGRIVNALYGPLWAYLNGLLVLIGGTWFRYQVLANFLIYLLSGSSMYCLLKRAGVSKSLAVTVAIFFMTTFSIQYWIQRQGFTSWGTAVLPLCLLPLLDMVEKGRIPVVKLAVLMALMTQIHLFSSLLLAVIYAFYFVYTFIRSEEKVKLMKDVSLAVLLFLGLTANLVSSLFYLYTNNQLIPPFVNQQMSNFAVDSGSDYWLFYPYTFVPLMGAMLAIYLVNRKRMTPLIHLTGALALLFLILSSDILPWTAWVKEQVPFVSLIQFPFRFFAPFTVLFAFFMAQVYSTTNWSKHLKQVVPIVVVLIGAGQILYATNQTLQRWHTDRYTNKEGIHTYVYGDDQQVRDSFYSGDLKKSLELLQKGTPDYLPVYDETGRNNYNLYKEKVVDPNPDFQKIAAGTSLIVKWNQAEARQAQLPIVLYHGSEIAVNGKKVSPSLSEIGTPTVQAKSGENKVRLWFNPPLYVNAGIWLAILFWLFCPMYYVIKQWRNKKAFKALN
ncbi:hypothetical protein [Enterococcus pallens]|uniref:Membrane protein 6-pyruvoyl-tetrahydropterin synthase-related domain-containing protein n=1 Tax=Enterococcus pallens ATCC BAA-351 TaxID=1158607 RepID=R2Q573_9ENTE|nr:hypothetical protein [Enterococcus pallens]EOH91677.1 hypothetical protein UAU_02979 [Enterococcus pallens ATCC BAA-351]EOU25105.1 hypothetical protein I588_01093 [Enterococcus pallens ATCC BAA-351]